MLVRFRISFNHARSIPVRGRIVIAFSLEDHLKKAEATALHAYDGEGLFPIEAQDALLPAA